MRQSTNLLIGFIVLSDLYFTSSCQFATAQGQDLAGVWRATKTYTAGIAREEKPRFLSFKSDGKGPIISNGVESYSCWGNVAGNQIKYLDFSPMLWRDEVWPELIEGQYQISGDVLRIAKSTDANAFDPGKFEQHNWAWEFERVALADHPRLAFKNRDKQVQEQLEKLSRLRVRFTTDLWGEIVGVDFTSSAVSKSDFSVLTSLPGLKDLKVEGNPIPTEIVSLLPGVQITGPSEMPSAEWLMLNTGAWATAFFQGLRELENLAPVPQPVDGWPVFEASVGDQPGLSSFLFPFRGKLFALHPAFSGEADLPNSLKHPKLPGQVPLGRVILNRCDYQIREFSGNPGRNWTFEPIPDQAAVFYDGQILRVCLPDGSVDAIVNVNKIKGNGRIALGSPADEDLIKAVLNMDPKEAAASFAGCPVIEARTGYLVGVVSRVENHDSHLQFDFDPMADLTRVPAPTSEYVQNSFLGLGGKTIAPSQVASLIGVLPPRILGLQFGKTPSNEYMTKTVSYLPLDQEDFLGREYLFSMFSVRNGGEFPITIARARGTRIRNDDQRVQKFTSLMFSLFGQPDAILTSDPGKGFLDKVELHWVKPNCGIFLNLSHFESTNALQIDLELDARDNPEVPSSLMTVKYEGAKSANQLLNEFFGRIKTLPPDPRPRVSREDILEAIKGTFNR